MSSLIAAAASSSKTPIAEIDKVARWPSQAIDHIKAGDTILSSGFGMCGIPDTLLESLSARPEINNLTIVSNNAGGLGKGLGRLFKTDQVSCMMSSFIGWDRFFGDLFLQGRIAVDLVPQGTMVERCRAGAFGIPAFYIAVGADTAVEEGTLVRRYAKLDSPSDTPRPIEYSKPRESRVFKGRKHILEEAIHGDVALVRAYKADRLGNCVFRRTASNFGPVFGMNAKYTIVEAEHIVESGELDPDEIDLQAIFVNCVVQATSEKLVEKPVFSKVATIASTIITAGQQPSRKRQIIASRAAREMKHGQYVNLGVGIPTLVADYLSPTVQPIFHSENGLLGMGPYPLDNDELDADIINAGKESVTIAKGGSCFDSATSFGMIRGGHLSMSMLGALEVSASGDLANYVVPGSMVRGMGGAMDLVSCPSKTKIIALTEHIDKNGRSKVVSRCSLPLTGSRCISRIITDLAVFDVDLERGGPLVLVEIVSDGSKRFPLSRRVVSDAYLLYPFSDAECLLGGDQSQDKRTLYPFPVPGARPFAAQDAPQSQDLWSEQHAKGQQSQSAQATKQSC
jgi:3-oxoacid CoA-transferase